jgi:hypothetical protein
MSPEKRDVSLEPLVQKSQDFVFVPSPHGVKKARVMETIELADGSGTQYKLDFGDFYKDRTPSFADDLYYPRESFFTEDDLLYFMKLEDIETLLLRPEVNSYDYDIYLPTPELPIEEYSLNQLVDFALQWQAFQTEIRNSHNNPSSQQ